MDFLSQQEHLQLVFLNGCGTKGQVEKLKEAGIPYIIATNRSINDTAATQFATKFYETLAAGERNIPKLFEIAKKKLENTSLQQSLKRRVYDGHDTSNDEFSWGLYELENHTKSEKLGEWFVNQNHKNALLTQAPSVPPPAFIGRDDDLQSVHSLLENNDNVVLVNGIGGIGKSTLAQAYWHKHQHQYSFLAWVTVVNDNLQESFLNSGLEQKLKIQIPEKTTIEERYQVLQRELSQIEGIKLLVLDNVNNPDTVHEFEMPNWKVLLTSRAAIPHYLQHTVGILSKADTIELFETYYDPAKEQTKLLEELLEGIGYHTLTIELLAKNLQQLRGKGYGLGDLCENLEEKGLLKPDRSLPVRTGYPTKQKTRYEAVISTMFDLQFNPLGEYARWLLLQFSVLPAISIEYGLMADFLQINEEARGQFDETLEDLVERGWLEKKEDGYKIHQVVQEVIRVKIEPNGENCGVLVDSLVWKLRVSDNLGQNPLKKASFLCFGNEILVYLEMERTVNVANLYNNIALIYHALSNYKQALKFHLKCIAITEEKIHLEFPDLAISYSNIGITYYVLGGYSQALEYQKKAVSITDRVLVTKDLFIIQFHSNLATTYRALGAYDKALYLQLKVIKTLEAFLESLRFHLAKSYNNIALTYQDLGNYTKALYFQTKCIVIQEEFLDPQHPQLATSYNNIALIYQKSGDYIKALKFQLKSLFIKEEILSPTHSSLVTSYQNIALIYHKFSNSRFNTYFM